MVSLLVQKVSHIRNFREIVKEKETFKRGSEEGLDFLGAYGRYGSADLPYPVFPEAGWRQGFNLIFHI